MSQLRLAIIGCGAQTELHHLPAIARSDRISVTCLVDTSLTRAQDLAARYGVAHTSRDYREAAEFSDAAVVALPNSLHAPVTVALLEKGLHVLVEKPMALSSVECDSMMDASKRCGRVLAVGLDFRFFYSSQLVKHILSTSLIGDIVSFDLRYGSTASWPFASDYIVRPDSAGGGVLLDHGVHVLDLLLWWVGDPSAVEYYDDSLGGLEANSEVRLSLAGGAAGLAEISRTRNLRNTCVIHGTRGTLEVDAWNLDGVIRLTIGEEAIRLVGRARPQGPGDRTFRDVFLRQIDDFADAVASGREPFVTGREGRRSVGLVETCYSVRQELFQPWVRSAT